MRQLRYVDFDCPACGASCTRFVYFDTELQQPCGEDEAQYCREPLSDAVAAAESEPGGPCGTVCDERLVTREMSGVGYMKTINKNNSDFNERERERLEKRQDHHWKHMGGRDEAIDRERAFMKKQGAVGGVK